LLPFLRPLPSPRYSLILLWLFFVVLRADLFPNRCLLSPPLGSSDFWRSRLRRVQVRRIFFTLSLAIFLLWRTCPVVSSHTLISLAVQWLLRSDDAFPFSPIPLLKREKSLFRNLVSQRTIFIPPLNPFFGVDSFSSFPSRGALSHLGLKECSHSLCLLRRKVFCHEQDIFRTSSGRITPLVDSLTPPANLLPGSFFESQPTRTSSILFFVVEEDGFHLYECVVLLMTAVHSSFCRFFFFFPESFFLSRRTFESFLQL